MNTLAFLLLFWRGSTRVFKYTALLKSKAHGFVNHDIF